jgi:group I intron endonuclease
MREPYKIYKVTNIINGKIYIGFTNKPLHKRAIEHKCLSKKGSNFLLHKAIKKYGFECFKWESIFESLDKDFLLNKMENYFIVENNSFYENGFGYNMTFGGDCGMKNMKHTEETKNKLKIARSKRKVEPMLGKKHSAESKEKMRISRLNNPNRIIQAQIAGKTSAEKRKNDVDYKLKQSQRIKEWWALRKAQGI